MIGSIGEGIKNERELVRKLKALFEEQKSTGLKKIFIHTNLATKKFRDIWSEWWKGDIPPQLEEGFNLPIVYFATKLIETDKFEFFAPWEFYSSKTVDANYLLVSLRNYCNEKRNLLLDQAKIEKRKEMLKILLKIPV